ncbi:MAG: T9SS type A sorting domain-containing protein, partial [Bacteroidota bacterium]
DDIKVFEYTNKVVSVNNNSDLPVKFMLSQNYPNPFNPSTTIKYSISSSVIAIPTSREKQSQEIPLVSQQVGNPRNDYAQTTLKVYDILGREVAILVNKQQQPGDYEVEFDAKKLTSGVYYYTLRSGDFVESRKMLLLK